jgi:hypothetical protein
VPSKEAYTNTTYRLSERRGCNCAKFCSELLGSKWTGRDWWDRKRAFRSWLNRSRCTLLCCVSFSFAHQLSPLYVRLHPPSFYRCPRFIILHCIFYFFLLCFAYHPGVLFQFGSRKHTFVILTSPFLANFFLRVHLSPCCQCWLVSAVSGLWSC